MSAVKKCKRITAVLLAFAIFLSAMDVQALAAGISVTDNISELNLSELDAMISELDGLAAQCRGKGISCDYETVRIAVLKKYSQLLAQDKADNYAEQLKFTLNSLNRLYEQAKANLQGCLDGSISPLDTPKYLTSARRVEGSSLYANTTQGERPVYFVGYGHFGSASNDIPVMNSLGASIIQNEIGPSSVIVPRGQGSHEGLTDSDQFDVSTAEIYSRIVPMLQRAQANNVCVSLLLSQHYFPSFLYDLYPDLKFDESGSFLGYHINHPVARRVIEVYLRTIIPIVMNYDSLFDICLTNEPVYTSLKSGYDYPKWQEYLKNKYFSIAELDKALGTSYKTFDEVLMPAESDRTALAYEWVLFNNSLFSGWHKWMTGIIKEYKPGLPVDAKVMSYLSYNPNSQWRGTDYAQFAEFCDFNGNDTWANVSNKNSKMQFKMAWYDFMGDIKNVPIINSEDHIIGDRSQLYSDKENKLLTSFVGADMWQGAIHGRDANTIWVWERSTDDASDFNGSILSRPECIDSVGEAALDLNRLAYEVQAFDKTKAEVAILFSDTSRVYDSMYQDFVLQAYNAATFTGKNVRFVTENQIGSLENGLLLIVPNSICVKSSTLTAVSRYAKSNKVLLLGKCMDLDEYGNPQNAQELSSLYRNCTIIGSVPFWGFIKSVLKLFSGAFKNIIPSFAEKTDEALKALSLKRNFTGLLASAPVPVLTVRAIRDKILKMSPNNIKFTGGLLNTTVMNVEWRAAEYNGKLLVNVCNYSNQAIKNVSLVYQGKTVGTLDELIRAKQLKDSFTLEPYEPMLFSIAK